MESVEAIDPRAGPWIINGIANNLLTTAATLARSRAPAPGLSAQSRYDWKGSGFPRTTVRPDRPTLQLCRQRHHFRAGRLNPQIHLCQQIHWGCPVPLHLHDRLGPRYRRNRRHHHQPSLLESRLSHRSGRTSHAHRRSLWPEAGFPCPAQAAATRVRLLRVPHPTHCHRHYRYPRHRRFRPDLVDQACQ